MKLNNINCDIVIGKSAGSEMVKDVSNAKYSVKILSPILSPRLIKELIILTKRNIDIQLITSDDIEDFNSGDKNILQLIKQKKNTNQESIAKKEKWTLTNQILGYVTSGVIFSAIALAIYFKHVLVTYMIIPIGVLFLIIRLFEYKISKLKFFTYKYTQLFPFKVFLSPKISEKSHTYINAKLYIIDDKVAYLGSLDYTGRGILYNYETQIKTTDENSVKELIVEFDQLFNHSNLPTKNIQEWGSELYDEPVS